jgi:NDP-sugar pyrophosphorylase family protein
MDAVILAAGRGTRLKEQTEHMPKPLISVLGRPILERILESLPAAIEKIFIVTSYKEAQLHAFCATHARGGDIRCISQGEQKGTYGALASTAPLLSSPFLVINGDDIDSKTDLERLIAYPRAMGVARKKIEGYYSITTDRDGNFERMLPQTENEKRDGALIATGAYVLDLDFFSLAPVMMRDGEYGIPHTLRAARDIYPIPIVELPDWIQINTPEDLVRAEEQLRL